MGGWGQLPGLSFDGRMLIPYDSPRVDEEAGQAAPQSYRLQKAAPHTRTVNMKTMVLISIILSPFTAYPLGLGRGAK